MIAEVRTITTKKGDTMAFARLEDLTGSVDVTVFPKLLKEQKPLWAAGKIVVIYGKADVRNGRVSVVADSAQDYVDDAKIIEDKGSVAYRFRNGAVETPPDPRSPSAPPRNTRLPPLATPPHLPPAWLRLMTRTAATSAMITRSRARNRSG